MLNSIGKAIASVDIAITFFLQMSIAPALAQTQTAIPDAEKPNIVLAGHG